MSWDSASRVAWSRCEELCVLWGAPFTRPCSTEKQGSPESAPRPRDGGDGKGKQLWLVQPASVSERSLRHALSLPGHRQPHRD